MPTSTAYRINSWTPVHWFVQPQNTQISKLRDTLPYIDMKQQGFLRIFFFKVKSFKVYPFALLSHILMGYDQFLRLFQDTFPIVIVHSILFLFMALIISSFNILYLSPTLHFLSYKCKFLTFSFCSLFFILLLIFPQKYMCHIVLT